MNNIIEYTQDIVRRFPKIEEFCADVHIDFTEPRTDTYGLSPIGDVLLSEDVLGNQIRRHNFHLYATYQSQSDYDRLANSGVLLELQYYLENNKNIEFNFNGVKGELQRIECANGMLYEIPSENVIAPVLYQIQLQVYYKIFS